MVFSVLFLSTIVQVCDDRDDGLADADAGADADTESWFSWCPYNIIILILIV